MAQASLAQAIWLKCLLKCCACEAIQHIMAMASFRSAPTTFHSKGRLGMKHHCGRRCEACRYNRMRHIGKGGLVSSFSAESEDATVQESIARSRAFTRACQSKNVT